jgi:hypothetical protein
MSSADVDPSAPEFHLVVRRPNRRGPLAPYRFSIAIAFSMLMAGPRLWAALEVGAPIDGPLLHAIESGGFIWIVSGIVNKILATATFSSSVVRSSTD